MSSSSGTYYFMLLGRGDWPLYEMEYVVPARYSTGLGSIGTSGSGNNASSSSLSSIPGATIATASPASVAGGSGVQVGGSSESMQAAAVVAQQIQQKAKDDRRHVNQLIAHAALDILDEMAWQSTNNYLRVIDRFNEWSVSAYVTPGSARMLMVHDVKNEEGIGRFFADVYECYMKHVLNPFYACNSPIRSTAFDKRIEYVCHKFLT